MPYRLFVSLTLNQLRDTAYSMWTMLLPPVLMIALNLAFPRADKAAVFAGIIVFTGLTMGFINLPLTFHSLAEAGTLKRMRLSPRGTAMVPAALAASGLVLLLASFALVTALGLPLGALPAGVTPALAAWELWFGLTAVVAGFIITAAGKDLLAAKNLGNIAMMLFMALSGAFFTLDGLPGVLHGIDPAGSAFRGMTAAVSGAAQNPLDWILPIPWILCGAAAAVLSLQRSERDTRAPAHRAPGGPASTQKKSWKEWTEEWENSQKDRGGKGWNTAGMAVAAAFRRPQWLLLDIGMSVGGMLILRAALPGDWTSYLPYVIGIVLPMTGLSGAVWDVCRMRENGLLRRFAVAPRGLRKAALQAVLPALFSFLLAAAAALGTGALMGVRFAAPVFILPYLLAAAAAITAIALAMGRVMRSAVSALTWAPMVWLALSAPLILLGGMPDGFPALLARVSPAVLLDGLARMSLGAAAPDWTTFAAGALWLCAAGIAFARFGSGLPGRA